MNEFDQAVKDLIDSKLSDIESHLDSDVIFFYGVISPGIIKNFRDFIETLKSDAVRRDVLTIFLNTPCGSVETVEKLVDIIRHHYNKLHFIVPDAAMSAGTIFCMAGDKIFMDYSSSLGPIDPQVWNGKQWVPALGYLDKVAELIKKANDGILTDAEFIILQNQDLAALNVYEQAKNLTNTLLKEWLVKYKFKDWLKHRDGRSVTQKEKEDRANDVANKLGDNKYWHSHARRIGIETIEKLLKLKIEDYTHNEKLRKLIRSYNDLTTEFIEKRGYANFFHSRNYF